MADQERMILVWPAVYPPRPRPPLTDSERIFQAVLPYFHAASWDKSAAELASRISPNKRGKKADQLRRWREYALLSAKDHRAKFGRNLRELPKRLQPKAMAICQTAKL